MADSYANKTYKIEIEVTVSADELCEQIASKSDGNDPSELCQLQKALEKNETVLNQLMLNAVWSKLQEYVDYAAAQDVLNGLMKVAASLDPKDRENLGLSTNEFAESTRPLRTGSVSVSIDNSAISEKVENLDGGIDWQYVWKDLRKETELGRLMDKIVSPYQPIRYNSKFESKHYLLVRYLTQQNDGIHIQGRCTCEAVFEEYGTDETVVMEKLWKSFLEHTEKSDIAKRLRKGWQDCHSSSIRLD